MVNVVCMRWLEAFPASYVRLLRNAVRKNLPMEHRFICLTDNPNTLDSDIDSIRMHDMQLPTQYVKKGCWPKISMFAPGVLPPDEPTLFLDLDLVIRGDLSPFFDRLEKMRGLHALREWNPGMWNVLPLSMRPDRGIQSSILGFYPREQQYIYDQFMADKLSIMKRLDLDQDFISEVAKDRTYWPYEWTVSFKRHCVRHYPFNTWFPDIAEPENAKIVVFHGNPRPIDLVPLGKHRWGTKNRFGYGPVPWVRDYWLANDESWTDEPTTISS